MSSSASGRQTGHSCTDKEQTETKVINLTFNPVGWWGRGYGCYKNDVMQP